MSPGTAHRLSLRLYRHAHAVAVQRGWGRALRWAQWAPPACGGDPWLTLGIDPDLPGREWPRWLKLPGLDEPVPVRCRAAGEDGRAHAGLRLRNTDNDFGLGTVGGFMRTPDPQAPLLALTAGHVLAGSGTARRLDPVDFSDGGATLARGRVHGWAPTFGDDGEDTSLDVGAVRIDAAAANQLMARLPLPRGVAGIAAGQPVRLQTHERGPLPGRAKGLLTAFMRVGGNDALRYQLVQGLCFDVDGGSEPGDSGAALWDSSDRQVGLHAGSAPPGSAGNAIATPVARALNWFGGDLVTRGGEPAGAAAAPIAGLGSLPAAGAIVVPADRPAAPEPAQAVDVLARTMWGEARGELEAGMEAVAHVVLNRRDARRWWGSTVEAVCLKPFQFSCWNAGDTNRRRVLDASAADAQFAAALRIAARLIGLAAVERTRADTTGGATHYHAVGLTPLPNWARSMQPCQRLGRHVFYRGIA